MPPSAAKAAIRWPSLEGCDELAAEWIRRPPRGSEGGEAESGVPRYCESSWVRRLWYLCGRDRVSLRSQRARGLWTVIPFLCYVALLRLRKMSAGCLAQRTYESRESKRVEMRVGAREARSSPGARPIPVTREKRSSQHSTMQVSSAGTYLQIPLEVP